MISRERERLIWGVSMAVLIAIAVWSWAGAGRYQFHSRNDGGLFAFQVFDTRTRNVVTYVLRSGEWYRSDLSSGGKFVKITSTGAAPFVPPRPDEIEPEAASPAPTAPKP
jgi:hypothetical protein